MSNFTITRLANAQAMVSGTDSTGATGRVVLSTARYDEVRRELAILGAQEDFDSKVEDFFSELVEAADELKKIATAVPVEDPASFVVIREALEGEAGDRGLTLRFDSDGTVLNLIESGDTDRLVWLNSETLLVTEYVPDTKSDGISLEEAQAIVEQELGGQEVPVNGAGVENPQV